MMDIVLAPPPPTDHNYSQQGPSQGSRSSLADIRFEVEEPGQYDKDAENDKEANTQETFTQHLAEGNDWTQLGMDDDNDVVLSQSQDYNSPTPVDPLTVPWGRLMPVGPNSNGNGKHAAPDHGNGGAQFPPRPISAREAIEMLPRSPARGGSMATRSRSPSIGSERILVGGGGEHESSPLRIPFLGLKHLLPSNRFNEYVLGRSVKADVMAQKMDVPPYTESNPEAKQRSDAKLRRHDYVHAMISNRHCRVYCLLTNINSNGNSSHANSAPPEMEVFVEDTSGNGTLINGTTLLRRNERRKLHTGDVICLLNPKLLAKKLRSVVERKTYMSQYSYVFVNLYEQEARNGWGAMDSTGKSESYGAGIWGNSRDGGLRDILSPMSTTKKGVVNARATKCHSVNNLKSKRSLFASTNVGVGAGGDGTLLKSNYPCQQLSSLTNSGSNPSSKLGLLFRNNPNVLRSSSNTGGNAQRRIEEDYDLRDLLGMGTCGEVRRAIHRRTGEECAVKIISIGGRGAAGSGMCSEKLTAIKSEAEILRSLDHPYVVKLHDVFLSPGRAIYLVMELIRGGDLFDRIVDRGRFNEVAARRLLRRVLAALHYLHEERGIVHRDLKPENILVVDRRSDVNVKLTDFGLAKSMTAEGLKTFCGTPQYFAPEVLRRRHTVKGNGRYGKEIDCWSLGVILFVLLSGSPPFDVSVGLDAVANAEVVFHEEQWQTVSKEAQDLVMKLLEKDPGTRISVKDACMHKWVLVEDGDTHCHPLHDPVVVIREGRSAGVDSTMLAKGNGQKLCCDIQSTSKPTWNDNGGRSTDAPSTYSLWHDSGLVGQKDARRNGRECVCTRNGVVKFTRNESRGCSSDAPSKQPPSSPWRKTRADPLSPITLLNKKNNNYQGGKSQPSRAIGRRPSIWPAKGNDRTMTKAIQHACNKSQPSPNSSPIQKRQLFRRGPPTPKKITRRGAESIWAAGDTLPEPVIDEASCLVKMAPVTKKKVQSTLFPSKVGKIQEGKSDVSASRQLPWKDNGQGNGKRKSSTSTVTPPGNEQCDDVTLEGNKKRKACGKHFFPATREGAVAKITTATTNNTTVPAMKSELLEDNLQSDFSDDDEVPSAKSLPNLEKKPIKKILLKRRTESADSSWTIGVGGEPWRRNSKQPLKKEVPPPVPKESRKSSMADVIANVEDKPNEARAKRKDRKLVQTFLFGKPPPNDDGSPEVDSPATTAEGDPSRSNETRISYGGFDISRHYSGESIDGGTAAGSKGKQKSIKSWFRAKE